MRTDEIWYQLVAQSRLAAYLVKLLFGSNEEVKVGLSHKFQYRRRGVFGCHFESTADVVQHHLAKVFPAAVLVAEKVAAYTAAYVNVLDARHRCHLAIKLHQRPMVALQVAAQRGVDATVTAAFAAQLLVFATHLPHICRRPAEVAEHPVEVVALGHLLDFGKD